MSWTFDSANSGVTEQDANGVVTFSMLIANLPNRLFVCWVAWDVLGTTITSATIGATALTLAVSNNSSQRAAALLYCFDPPLGLNTVTINLSASGARVVAGGQAWSSSDPIVAPTIAQANGTNGAPSATVATDASALIVDAAALVDFTNLITNGGFETNTTGWSPRSVTETISRITSWAAYGAAAGNILFGANSANEGAFHAFTGAALTQYTAAATVRPDAGVVARIYLWDNVSGFQAGGQVTGDGSTATRLTVTATTGAAAATFRVYIRCENAAQTGKNLRFDGVQVQTGAVATPYIETNGGTASGPAGTLSVGDNQTERGKLNGGNTLGASSSQLGGHDGVMAWSDIVTTRGWSIAVASFASAAADTSAPATDAQIADALSGRRGTIHIEPRYTFRDKLWNELELITAAVRSCSIRFDSTRGITRDAAFSLDLEALIAIDPVFAGNQASSELPFRWIGVELEVGIPATGETITYPMGLYQLTSKADLTLEEIQHGLAQVVALDPAVLLMEAKGTPSTFALGSNYITNVAGILNGLGLTRQRLEYSPLTLPADMTFPPNTPWLEQVNKLLEGINFWPIWFDGEGVACSAYRGNPEQDTFEVDVVYSQDEPRMVVGKPFTRKSDWERSPNQITVTIESINRPIGGRTARNELRRPNGTTLIGKVIGEKRVADFAYDDSMLSELAVWYVVEAQSLTTRISLPILMDPRRNPTTKLREILSLQLDDWLEASGPEPARRYWHILGWSADLTQAGSGMQMELASLLPDTFVVGDPNGPGGGPVDPI